MVVLVVKVVKVVIRFGIRGFSGVIRVFLERLVTAMGDVPKMVPTHTAPLNAHVPYSGVPQNLTAGSTL